MQHVDAARDKHIGNQLAVAAPWHRFGTHQALQFAVGQFYDSPNRLLEFGSTQIIRVCTELVVSPIGVR